MSRADGARQTGGATCGSAPASESVAAFDFDGTLIRGDSLWRFLLFASGAMRLALRALPAIPRVAGYGVGLVPNHVAKERLLECVLGGRLLAEVAVVGRRFAEQRVPGLVAPAAIERLAWHRRQGHRCLLVSASLDVYLAPWSKAMGFDGLACSALAADSQGRVTGRLQGGNCFGSAKRERLLKMLPDRSRTVLYAYGDSRGDCEMLAEADHAYFRMKPWQRESTSRGC